MKVEKLKQMAIEAIYKDILYSLSPENIKNFQIENSSGIWTVESKSGVARKKRKLSPSQAAVSCVRAKLDEFLVGVYRHVREELWIKFKDEENKEKRPDVCLFLASILDDDFTSLDVSDFSSEDCSAPLDIIKTVAHHCSSLPEISLEIREHLGCFFFYPRCLATNLGSLKCLTNLKLDWYPSKENSSQFLAHLGKSCPNLKFLKLKNFPFGLDQVLALVLGLKAQLIPEFIKKEMRQNLDLFQFDLENDTCRNLENLRIKTPADDPEMQILSTVFLLRHFSLLQGLSVEPVSGSGFNRTIKAVCILHQMPRSDGGLISTQRGLPLKHTLNAPPTVPLNLKELTGKNGTEIMDSLEELKAVIALCPHLNVIHLGAGATNTLTPKQLQSVLTGQFSKVDTLSLYWFPTADARAAVLSVLGAQLKSLSLLKFDDLLDVATELAPCTQIKELIVSDGNFTLEMTNQSETFLSTLKELGVLSCVSQSTLPIPSLTELSLHCAHYGLDDNLPWDQLPHLYPNLQVFGLERVCESLTLDVVRELAMQFTGLREMELPIEMLKTDEEKKIADELATELEQLESPIYLQFRSEPTDDDLLERCVYQFQ